jgi:hypothetical protein
VSHAPFSGFFISGARMFIALDITNMNKIVLTVQALARRKYIQTKVITEIIHSYSVWLKT